MCQIERTMDDGLECTAAEARAIWQESPPPAPHLSRIHYIHYQVVLLCVLAHRAVNEVDIVEADLSRL